MARKFFRKFRRIKKNSRNSIAVLKTKTEIKNKKVLTLIVGVVAIVLVLGIYIFNIYKKYDGYKILDSVKIDSGENSKYIAFGDFVIKYSGDGISYIDGKETVWTEAFEMKAPMVDVCDEYLAICDKNTNDIILYNKKGREGKVTTNYPVIKIEVARQGVVAALLEDKKANYIEVYDKEGRPLVSHKTLLNENGYPIDFTISDDGTKMGVSYLTVAGGTMNNKLMFYNFSNAGKNADEKMVGQFDDYKETIVPTVKFVTNEDVIAVGENVLTTFNMTNIPELRKEIKFEEEIQKVFYNEKYVGLVFENTQGDNPYRMEVYNLSGNRVMQKEINMDYDNMKFAGENVVMYNDLNCQIVSLKAVTKFEYNFKESIKGIMPLDGSKTYLFMMNSSIDKVRLK